jgi:hypothetical protein
MMQSGGPQHPMKMVERRNPELQAIFRCHEHGMDCKRHLDEFPRRSIASPKNLVERCSMRKSVHVAAALVTLLAATSLASAQSGPSVRDQMACRSDAGKFCAEHVGKPPQMNACLKANKANLSDACRKVVESRGG